VLLCQLFSSWAAVKLVGCCGCIVVDDLEWNKLKAFLPVSMAFLACIFANIKTLQYANVETFVVFRASTPLFISLCDYAFLGRELPNMRSTACLVALLFAALGYVLTDATYHVKGYMWVAGWCAARNSARAIPRRAIRRNSLTRHAAPPGTRSSASTRCTSSTPSTRSPSSRTGAASSTPTSGRR